MKWVRPVGGGMLQVFLEAHRTGKRYFKKRFFGFKVSECHVGFGMKLWTFWKI